MASTFFGLHIGSSALSSFQVATNTTANNIANVKTTGYTRQEATLQAKDAINVTARYGSVGTGVTVTSIKQQRDLYYDNKYWENNSCYGRYEQKLYYMEQISLFRNGSGEILVTGWDWKMNGMTNLFFGSVIISMIWN